jgi:hypothetical protein
MSAGFEIEGGWGITEYLIAYISFAKKRTKNTVYLDQRQNVEQLNVE